MKKWFLIMKDELGKMEPQLMVSEHRKWIVNRWMENASKEFPIIIYEADVDENISKEMETYPNNQKYYNEEYFKKNGRIYYKSKKNR